MTELQIFQNPEFGNIRTVEENGSILFCGSDVAKALGYSNPTKAINDHCKGIVDRRTNDSLGRQQTMKFISEGDIYRLTARSELTSAVKFERWIFDEVLPSIRKHGAYATEATIDKIIANPDFGIELLTSLKEEREKSKLLEAQNEELKAELDESHEWYSIKRVANLNGISWKTLDWKKLKAAGEYRGYHPKKVFDPNFGQVNVYHRTAWEEAYPHLEL